MKGRFFNNGDLELEDGTIIHDPVLVQDDFDLRGIVVCVGTEEILITFSGFTLPPNR